MTAARSSASAKWMSSTMAAWLGEDATAAVEAMTMANPKAGRLRLI
jgi:hypothetical protein